MRWAVMMLLAMMLAMIGGREVAADPRCVVPPPVAAPAVTAAAPACHRATPAIEANVRAAIAKRFEPEHDGGKADVAFACDGLGPNIREIVVETGSGHGFSLELWRARRATNGSYDVRGIVYHEVRAKTDPDFEVAVGNVKLPELETVRAALATTVREVAPPPPPGTIGGMRGTFSSNDFHILVRLVDDDGRVVERTFTGYASSGEQNRYLALQRAREALQPILDVNPAPATAATFEDRELFADRFVAAVPHFDDSFFWWVMEREVQLARYVGSPRTLEGLLTRLANTKKDRSAVDTRAAAVAAIAAITGWDARAGGATIDAAARRYLAECKR